jgi:methylase of polypeptide subunit release factors
MTYKIKDVYGISVYHTAITHGGGIPIYPDFALTVQDQYPNRTFNNCLEWCAGPGFIGFALLAKQICNHLTLADIYQPSIDLVNATIKFNKLNSNTSVFLSDNFKSIPSNKFDLIVGNPPHFSNDVYAKYLPHWKHTGNRIYQDTNWKIHYDFFKSVKEFMTDDCKILLIENIRGCSEETFKDVIFDNGLEITNHFLSPTLSTNYWYLEIGKRA